MRTVVVALVLVLAGCGAGGSAEDPSSSSSPTKTEAGTTVGPTPTPVAATGTPVPEALSQFRCRPDAKGVWNASGIISNRSKDKATFQVTVVIGTATGESAQARTQQVAHVAAKGSVTFVITKIPAPQSGGPCHVQVLATS